jgi:hypothetical protein
MSDEKVFSKLVNELKVGFPVPLVSGDFHLP